jgi:hypothetical protein
MLAIYGHVYAIYKNGRSDRQDVDTATTLLC